MLFAVLSLSILPLSWLAGWIAAVMVWEAISAQAIDRYVLRQERARAVWLYAGFNFVGACVFQTLPLMALAEGSPVGVAVGAIWLAGSFVNNFVYFGGDRRTLLAAITPCIAAAVAGPIIAYGLSWESPLITVLILAGLFAARAYSLDHRSVVRELADRQVALVSLERKLSLAIDAAGDGMFEILAEGGLSGDQNWLALLGYEPGELELPVAAWREMVHPDDLGSIDAEFARHRDGETSHTTAETRMLCKDGSYKWILSRGRVVDRKPDGSVMRIIGTAIDVSARKALEQELEAARDLAESANKAKSVFVANMSHEIRTPLNGVVGIAGALARTRLTRSQRELVGLIQSSGQVLERLLTDILDQAKVEAGNFELEIAPFDLRCEFDNAAELMRARADEKGLLFELTYGAEAAGWFEGDAVRLRQIVSNLASNAIKFTEKGVVRIDVAVTGGKDGRCDLDLTVSDTGVGIGEEAASRLFERFSQADGSISRRFGGTGLRLAISRSLTELMGGQISVASKAGKGSVFTVCVPLNRVAPVETADEEAAGPDPSVVFAGLRVLLAEDHPTNQKVVQLILDPLGVKLHVVDNGEMAVEAFAAAAYDIILMDMQMPIMDGVTALGEIRRRERQSGAAPTPVAMLTANASAEHRTLAQEAGADHHVAKPITPDSLVQGMLATLSAAEVAERLSA